MPNHADFGDIDDSDPRLVLWKMKYLAQLNADTEGTGQKICSENTATLISSLGTEEEIKEQLFSGGADSAFNQYAQGQDAITSSSVAVSEENKADIMEGMAEGDILDLNVGDMILEVKKLDKQSSFNIESPLIQAGIRGQLEQDAKEGNECAQSILDAVDNAPDGVEYVPLPDCTQS
ncbi:MAG: hypothetical protein EBY39_07470 [Flavobacteriia bacterium]|nr:hypothetical protein [Flavobacteriia bacterium]